MTAYARNSGHGQYKFQICRDFLIGAFIWAVLIFLLLSCADERPKGSIAESTVPTSTDHGDSRGNKAAQISATGLAPKATSILGDQVDSLILSWWSARTWKELAEARTPDASPEVDGIDNSLHGRLELNGSCAYLIADNNVGRNSPWAPARYVLSLPQDYSFNVDGDRALYDGRNRKLWFQFLHGGLEGPVASGERINAPGVPENRRSDRCGNEIILRTEAIFACATSPSLYRTLCQNEEYARVHRVSHTEAARRIETLLELVPIRDGLRLMESERTAGWGVYHGENLRVWLLLTGDDPPGEATRVLAEQYEEIEVRTGATHSFEQLRVAQDLVSNRLELHSMIDSSKPETDTYDLVSVVKGTWIDHAENALGIAIDVDGLPIQVVSEILGDEAPGGLPETRRDSNSSDFVYSPEVRESTLASLACLIGANLEVSVRLVPADASDVSVRHDVGSGTAGLVNSDWQPYFSANSIDCS